MGHRPGVLQQSTAARAEQQPRHARLIRTPGMAAARRMFASHAESERLGTPVTELLGAWEEERFTRRHLLLAGAGAAMASRPSRSFAALARRRPPARPLALRA